MANHYGTCSICQGNVNLSSPPHTYTRPLFCGKCGNAGREREEQISTLTRARDAAAVAFCSAHKRSLDSCSMGRSEEWDKADSDRTISWTEYLAAESALATAKGGSDG